MVLIVEDDRTLRRLLEMGLRSAGYETATAENGAVAMGLVTSRDFEVVLVDLMMPVMDGLRFVRWLRSEARLGVPVLMLTANNRPEIAHEARAAGADDVVLKPIGLPALLERLSAIRRP